MYKIIADSSCDIYSVDTAPMTIYNDEVTYVDDENMDIKDMLDRFAVYKGRTYTACPGTSTWIDLFEGSDEIYVVTITSGLSGTYNSAEAAKAIYEQDHEDVKIKVFDTLSTGPEMVLIIEKIQELKEAGCSFEEVCEKMESYMKHTRLFFTLQSVHNLVQNGRINKVLGAAIGALGISIIATASPEGTINSVGKSRGEKKTINATLKHMMECGYKKGKLRICHVENESMANKFKEAFLELGHDIDVKVYAARGLVSYYAERGGILIASEMETEY